MVLPAPVEPTNATFCPGYAISEMFLRTTQKKKADPLYDEDEIFENEIMKRIDDLESVEAMKFFDATKVFFDPAHGIYTSTAATPLKTPCVNVMMKGADYEEEFKAVYSSYETDFKKIYG